MRTNNGNLYLEIQTSRKSPVGIVRSSFWDKKVKKVGHKQHGRVTGCSLEQLRLLQLAFREKTIPITDPEALELLGSREWGASQAVIKLATSIGLNKFISSRSDSWVDYVMAMIVGRLVFQGSKLSLCNLWEDTGLWELCGVKGKPKVKGCYEAMDILLSRQKHIQKKLFARHMKEGSLILYDITSSYFEGEYEQSELVKFGYNRDQKKGHEQAVIGLVCTQEGIPVACEVFAGNTKDESTVVGKIDSFRKDYGLDHFVFVGDRGMITQGQFERIHATENLEAIGALTHGQMKALLKREVIQPELFDEKMIEEIQDPDDPAIRYCLCKNPWREERDQEKRQKLIWLTERELRGIADYKKKTSVEKLGARIGKALARYKVGKYIEWRIEADKKETISRAHKITWELKHQKIEQEEKFDGCYIIRSDVPSERLNTEEIVKAYKSLIGVEQAFRNLKTVHLETRPVYHKKDDRIRAHVFICMLSYYLQWHMTQRLRPLFEADGKGQNRRWTLQGVIESLKGIRTQHMRIGKVGFEKQSKATEEQQKIQELLAQKT